jgi:hypothetical protein
MSVTTWVNLSFMYKDKRGIRKEWNERGWEISFLLFVPSAGGKESNKKRKKKKTEEEEVGGEPISRIHTVLIILFSLNLNRKGYSL